MKKFFQARKKMLTGIMVLAMVASLTTAVVVALTTRANLPTLAVDGIELRLREDGSIQALFSVSGQNLGDMRFSGANLLLHYNPDYMIPSDWVTNEELGAVNTRDPSATDANDPLHHLFFRADEELYNGTDDPFVWQRELGGTTENAGSIGITKPEASSISLLLALEDSIPAAGHIRKETVKNQQWSYIACPEGENSVSVGTLSFRVRPEMLPDLIEKFAGKSGMEIRADDADRTLLIEAYVDTGMAEKEQKWFLQYLIKKTRPETWQQAQISDDNNEANFNITINFIDALIHAEPVEDEIIINAYQAYTDAEVSDLALAMQKYADSIRVTYASGVTADQSMYWGDPAEAYNMPEGGPGMIFETADGSAYRFTWDDNGADYTMEKAQTKTQHTDGEGDTYYTYSDFLATTSMTRGSNGLYTYTFEDGSSFIYNARGGTYKISQYFTYMEEEGIPIPDGGNPMQRKAYPFPMEVSLTVTPVTMTGTEIDNQVLTYAVGSVPYDYGELDLTNRAKLKLDTVLAGVTPTMYINWNPDKIADVKFNNGTTDIHWPKDSSEDKADRVGDYPFDTALLRPDIQTAYPWMTVPEERYNLNSLRRIRDKNDPDWPWAEDFEMWAEPDDETGDLIVNIAKKEKDESGNYTGDYEDIPANTYTVYLYQPDGTYIDPAWFSGSSFYQEQLISLRRAGWTKDAVGYSIRISTNAFDGAASARDALQQYINLGGWFGSELELTASADTPKARTDRTTAYSRARQNVYLRNYILMDGSTPAITALNQPLFDFTGSRAGLLPVYAGAGLGNLVTLPDAVSAERPSQWVMVRYDASTGVEPGYLRQFKVDQWSHTNPAGGLVAGTTVIYGENPADTNEPKAGEPFARTYDYSGFGRVENPAAKNNQVKVRVELQNNEPEPIDAEALLLTYEQSGDSIIHHPHNDTYNVDEVKRVVFNTRQVGYTYQQVVTLTLTNRGDIEVKGISIDPRDASGNAYFTILSAPAVNLAPGASTTFQISYAPNLAVGKYETNPIRIYASNYSAIDPIKNFEAEVEITQGPVHEVRLLVRPTDLSMGDAGFVAGVDSANIYDNTAMGNTYAEGAEVWVLTYPKDECALIEAPYYYNGEIKRNEQGDPVYDKNGDVVLIKVYLEEYDPANLAPTSPDFRTTDGRERLFKLPAMPNHSITVYVDYYEPIYSKLRLSDLDAYAWEWPKGGTPDGCVTPDGDPSEWVDKHEQDLREGQSGNYNVVAFDSDREEYLVILDDEMESCGVTVTLRNVVLPLNALGINIELTPVTVEMVLDDVGKTRICDDVNGDTSVPTRHYSDSFDAPLPGTSRTVTVTIGYDDRTLDLDQNPTHIYEGKRVTRTYKVKFVKKYSGEPEHTLHAGNSPYGMIENDDTITNKIGAKRDFDLTRPGNAFSFTAGLTPVKAFAADGTTPLLSNIYWEEAWNPDADINYDAWKTEWLSGKSINFDKIAPALFIYVGEPFDDPGVSDIHNNAGDLIQNTEVKRSLTYYTLRSSSNLQSKFNSTTTENISLGTYMVGNGDAAGYIPNQRIELKTEDGQMVTNIRPGVYKLTYTFVDYDGVTELSFVRPLIVLNRNGDMNADLNVTTGDVDAIQNRFGGKAANPVTLPLNSANYPAADKLVYRYRILDANNDRNINNIDANLIRQVLSTRGTLTEFYLPIDYTNHINSDHATEDGTTL